MKIYAIDSRGGFEIRKGVCTECDYEYNTSEGKDKPEPEETTCLTFTADCCGDGFTLCEKHLERYLQALKSCKERR